MAVRASIIFTQPATAEAVALANYAEDCPIETLYSVAGVLDYYDYPKQIPAEAAEAAIDGLLGVVTGLTSYCWRPEDASLASAIELWLSSRGRF